MQFSFTLLIPLQSYINGSWTNELWKVGEQQRNRKYNGIKGASQTRGILIAQKQRAAPDRPDTAVRSICKCVSALAITKR